MSESLRQERRDGVLWLTLNEPERRNSLSAAILEGLQSGLDDAATDDEVRSIVITGSGSAFCAGADLKAGGIRPSGGENPFARILRTIWEHPRPVVARINGHAFGGGIGLAAACDLAIAAEGTQFSFSEVRLGVVPAMISVVVLPKIGIQNALWLFLTGERFDATRAAQIGLVHRVVPAAELDDAVASVLALLRLGGPQALREAKQLVRRVPELSMAEGFRHTTAIIERLFASPEAAEGMQAFVEKRPPAWASETRKGNGDE